MKNLVLIIFISGLISACSPEVGSKEWCKSLKAQKKADWSIRETKDYAKHCLF